MIYVVVNARSLLRKQQTYRFVLSSPKYTSCNPSNIAQNLKLFFRKRQVRIYQSFHACTVIYRAPRDVKGIYMPSLTATCRGVTPRRPLVRIENMYIVQEVARTSALHQIAGSKIYRNRLCSLVRRKSKQFSSLYIYHSMLPRKNQFGFWSFMRILIRCILNVLDQKFHSYVVLLSLAWAARRQIN